MYAVLCLIGHFVAIMPYIADCKMAVVVPSGVFAPIDTPGLDNLAPL